MKRQTGIAALLFILFFIFSGQDIVFAQDSVVTVNKAEVSSWFSRNWIWITAAVVVLIIIIAASGGRTSTRTTTVVRDDLGNTKRVTTTEINE